MSDIIFFEKVLIKFLFSNEVVREKTLPFLVPEIFDDLKNISLVKSILKINEKFKKFPSVPDMKLELSDEDVYKRLLEIMELDVSEYQTDLLLEQIEDFIRNKLIHNINVDIAINLTNDKIEEIKLTPDKLREAISFSFDTKIGLDFLEEENRLYDFLHNKDKIVESGLTELNQSIEGGFHEKSLTLFLAQTNLGKSLIMCSLAVDAILKNKNVLYISCEMSEDKISERIMANLFNVSLEDLKLLTKSKFHEKFGIIKQKIQHKLIVKEYPPKAINCNHIRNLLKELSVRKKFKPDIIFVDYLGLLNSTYNNKNDNSYLEVKRISEELRAVAVETALPIISAVQSNRSGFNDVEIDLTNISDSIGTAATADIIIGVTQSDDYRKLGKFSWIILKNRYGINGKRLTVNVDYYKMRVINNEESSTEDLAKNITKDIPESDKEKKQELNNTINDVKNIIKKDTNDKFKKMIDFE